MLAQIAIFVSGQTYYSKKAEITQEGLDALYDFFSNIQNFDHYAMDNEEGGKDFFPGELMRQAVVSIFVQKDDDY